MRECTHTLTRKFEDKKKVDMRRITAFPCQFTGHKISVKLHVVHILLWVPEHVFWFLLGMHCPQWGEACREASKGTLLSARSRKQVAEKRNRRREGE